jgi:hypothetical protein
MTSDDPPTTPQRNASPIGWIVTEAPDDGPARFETSLQTAGFGAPMHPQVHPRGEHARAGQAAVTGSLRP